MTRRNKPRPNPTPAAQQQPVVEPVAPERDDSDEGTQLESVLAQLIDVREFLRAIPDYLDSEDFDGLRNDAAILTTRCTIAMLPEEPTNPLHDGVEEAVAAATTETEDGTDKADA